jgi:heme-degrading monooxygenase HmoA
MKGENAMYASATQIQLLPDKIDEVVRIFENDVVPAVKTFPGLQHFYLLTDAETGKGYTITVFETEEAASAFYSSGLFQQQLGKIRESFAGPPPMREIFEVRVHF